MQYYGTRLSENISKREPEGYLLCLNVPVARTGMQEYLPEELGLPPGQELIPVFRPEEEVFSPETLASFEGMPVTNDHPPDGVDVRNIRHLQAGHAHNVRRGTGEESDLLLADLMITDPRLIDAILAGKREISCGYTYELQEEDGKYIQRKIRGNHIAVVDAGRAGSRVSIKDGQASVSDECKRSRDGIRRSQEQAPKSQSKNERRQSIMKKSLTRWLARMAKDGDVETVAEFIEAMAGEAAETPETPETEEKAAEAAAEEPVTLEVPENREITIDSDAFSALLERLDNLLALLAEGLAPEESAASDEEAPAEETGKEIAEIVEEALEAAQAAETAEGEAPDFPADPAGNFAEEIAEIVEAVVDPAVSTTLEPKEEDCGKPDPAVSRDALRAALMTFRPVLAKMTPRDRRKVCADIAANLRSGRRTNDAGTYAALASARKAPVALNELGKRIMAARNPNYK